MSLREVKLLLRMGHTIRLERLRRRWTLDDLSQKTGFSRGKVRHVERGESKISIIDLEIFSRALGISPSELVACAEENAKILERQGS